MRIAPFTLVALLFCGLASITWAAQSDAHLSTPVTARLITAQDAVPAEGRTLAAGLDLQLAEGWKTYWRTPGEVGTPPRIDWTGSANIAEVEIQWPAPERFTAFGIQNFGYHGDVVLPLRITLNEPGMATRLRAQVSLLVCSDICVPEDFPLALDLQPGSGIDQVAADRIAQFVARVPEEGPAARVSSALAHVDERGRRLTLALDSLDPMVNPDVFPELGDNTALGAPDIRLASDGKRLWAQFPILTAGTPDKVRITVTDGASRAFAVQALPVDAAPAPPFRLARGTPGAARLASIAFLAFLGGAILNLMPCVLPVLSIKLSSALRNDPTDRPRVRQGFLAAAGGVVVFMWLLAAVLFGLKWAGLSVGWGVQFQNPVFLALLIVIMAVFAGNLFGAFEITLPSRLQTRLANSGRNAGLGGDFLTGLFAAVMATPCSAPLLGTAVAFALAGRGIDIAVIFTALGFGLALPYLVIAALPGLVTRLPTPGRWMLLVKAGLGLLLLATVGWLVWVLAGVAGLRAALAVLALAIATTGLLSLARMPTVTRLSGAAMLTLLALAAAPTLTAPAAIRSVASNALAWQAFDRAEIARHVAAGRVVLVDITADWCLTCKANKALVLERDPVRAALSREGMVPMQADWTRPNESISLFLESNGRFGIPFNAVYGPGAPEGIILSEILTSTAVLQAIEQASPR